MLNVAGIGFWLYFVYFLIATVFAFFIPGDLFVSRLRLGLFQRIVLSIIVGMVAWGWQGTIFGYLGVRWLSYGYLLVTFALWVLWVARKLKKPHFTKIVLSKFDWLLIALVTIGTFSQVSLVWLVGTITPNGLYICCSDPSDTLFHISLTKEIIDNFPPFRPGMYGVVVHNYHYWSNTVVAELVRVFNFPLIATQYQYFATLVSLFLGLTSIVLVQILKIKKGFAAWLLFFLYFGGDFAYLFTFFIGKGFNFGLSGLEDGLRFLSNPPRAYSLIIFFGGLSLLSLWIKKRETVIGILMAFIMGSLIGFKVYTGIFALTGLVALGLYFLIKKDFRMILPLFIAPILSLVQYLPVNSESGGLYYTGFWIFENFIVKDSLGLIRWELARVIYVEHHNWLRVAQTELTFMAVYIFSIFGSKIIGLIQTRKSLSLLPKELHIFLLSGLFVSAVIGFFFQQNAGGSNTFNFLVSVFIIGSIYTALTCYYISTKLNKVFVVLFIGVIVLLTVPRFIYGETTNIKALIARDNMIIGNDELEAYKYIRENIKKDAVILVDYTGLVKADYAPYVGLLTERNIFLSGMRILESHKVDMTQRQRVMNTVLFNKDPYIVEDALQKNHIDYILLSTRDKFPAGKYRNFTTKVFENKKIRLLKPLHDPKYSTPK